MTIRTRLTVWYAGVLLASTVFMALVMKYEFVYERQAVADSGNPAEPMEEEIAEVIFYFGLPSALVIGFGGWLLLRKALAPLNQLTRAAERIRAENLNEPLPRSGNGDELDRLAAVLNVAIQRLDTSFQRIRDFSLYASHELKTPLTVIRSDLETSLKDDEKVSYDPERDVRLLNEVDRLTHIVDGLTFLTTADAGQLVLKMVPVSLDDLVRESLEDIQALAQPNRIHVHLKECLHVTVSANRRRLRQLLLILADNAIKYNHPQGTVTVALRAENKTAKLTISNTGLGFASGDADRVFDRFFRGKSSLCDDVEGCGLGLAIAKSIVEAHGGHIQCTSEPHRLTEFVLQFPAL